MLWQAISVHPQGALPDALVRIAGAMNDQPNAARRSIPTWLWMAVAALFGFAIYTAFETWNAERQLAGLISRVASAQHASRDLAAQQDQYQQELRIIAAPETIKYDFRPEAPSLPPIAAYWNPHMGIALAGDQVPSPDEADTFELWVKTHEGDTVGAFLFHPNPAGQILLVLRKDSTLDPKAADALTAPQALFVTEEPDGGGPSPSANLKWAGVIPAAH
jgi:hypothetical protein